MNRYMSPKLMKDLIDLSVAVYQTQEGGETFDSDPMYFIETVYKAFTSGKKVDVDRIFLDFGEST